MDAPHRSTQVQQEQPTAAALLLSVKHTCYLAAVQVCVCFTLGSLQMADVPFPSTRCRSDLRAAQTKNSAGHDALKTKNQWHSLSGTASAL